MRWPFTRPAGPAPMHRDSLPLAAFGPFITAERIVVASFTSEGPRGRPEEVHLMVQAEGFTSFMVRLKSRAAVDRLVATIEAMRDEVWPGG